MCKYCIEVQIPPTGGIRCFKLPLQLTYHYLCPGITDLINTYSTWHYRFTPVINTLLWTGAPSHVLPHFIAPPQPVPPPLPPTPVLPPPILVTGTLTSSALIILSDTQQTANKLCYAPANRFTKTSILPWITTSATTTWWWSAINSRNRYCTPSHHELSNLPWHCRVTPVINTYSPLLPLQSGGGGVINTYWHLIRTHLLIHTLNRSSSAAFPSYSTTIYGGTAACSTSITTYTCTTSSWSTASTITPNTSTTASTITSSTWSTVSQTHQGLFATSCTN